MEAVIQNCRLYYRYEKTDDQNAPTVLLLHGWGCDGSIFHVFEEELKKHASLLMVDFPGHGQSAEPPEPWGVPEYAEQTYQLLETLKIAKVHIIAHSFGGRVAIWLSSHHPERVDKMVLTGGAGLRACIPDAEQEAEAVSAAEKAGAAGRQGSVPEKDLRGMDGEADSEVWLGGLQASES